jgi:hypothetical protein
MGIVPLGLTVLRRELGDSLSPARVGGEPRRDLAVRWHEPGTSITWFCRDPLRGCSPLFMSA